MQGLSQSAELVQFKKDPDDPEWYVAQLAISGTLCVPFSVGADVIGEMADEAQLMSYLENQASTLIEHYGDARAPKPAFGEYLEN